VWAEKFAAHDPDDLRKLETFSATWNDVTGLFGSDCGIIHACDRVQPTSRNIVVAKTHAPFLPLKQVTQHLHGLRYNSSDVGIGTFLLLPIRNPLDNWDAWIRYREKKTQMSTEMEAEFPDYLRRWSQHHIYWLSSAVHANVPRFVFRFEDLGQAELRTRVLSLALRRSGLWDILGLHDTDIQLAINDPRVQPFAVGEDNHVSVERLAEGYRIYRAEDIELALTSVPSILRAFGYFDLYTLWLEAIDHQLPHEEVIRRTAVIIKKTADNMYEGDQ
jgi:hypothetical protein